METNEYEQTEKYCLENLDKSIYDWETAAHALERFIKKIEEIDKEYEDKKILIVGHAFTINLYFAKFLEVLDDVYRRFNKNDFADWGIIKNQKVVKDIAIQ